MLKLDQLIYNAICADSELMTTIGNRVESTCFEVSPDAKDNTPLPYIVIRDEGKQPAQATKDDDWMPSMWQMGAAIEVGAKDPNEVDDIAMMAMKAVNNYITDLYNQGEYIPNLLEGFPKTDGVQWDWMKPCYWDLVHYVCDVQNNE
jgi:hypothetical protein